MDWVKQVLDDYPWTASTSPSSISTPDSGGLPAPGPLHPHEQRGAAPEFRKKAGFDPINCSPPIRPTIIRPTRPRSRDSCATGENLVTEWHRKVPDGNWSPCAATGAGK